MARAPMGLNETPRSARGIKAMMMIALNMIALRTALFGLWWADPVAGLVMVPIIAREGIAGWQGKPCRENCH